MVKETINALACVLIASSAFGQTGTTTTKQQTTIQQTPAAETASGTVTTTYEPGKIVVVGSEAADDTFSYVLDKTVPYVNKAGRKVDERQIKRGTRVHLYYDDTGQTHMVNRVVVDEPERIRNFKPQRLGTK
jgi:hypothetical protein